MTMFAANTKLYTNFLVTFVQLEENLQKVSEWTKRWLLPLNTLKCLVLHLERNSSGRRYILSNYNLIH